MKETPGGFGEGIFQKKINRADFLKVGVGIVAGVIGTLTAQDIYKEEVSPSLTRQQELLLKADRPHVIGYAPDGSVTDVPYQKATGNTISFYLNGEYDGTSLQTQFSSSQSGVFRIASWQELPLGQKGGLVDRTYSYTGGQQLFKYPVIGVEIGEVDRVAIGFDPNLSDPNTLQPIKARVYEIGRNESGLTDVKFTRFIDLPSSIRLRNS
jgi:hypothetical protein